MREKYHSLPSPTWPHLFSILEKEELSGCRKHGKIGVLGNWNVARGKINIIRFEIYRSPCSVLYSIPLAKKKKELKLSSQLKFMKFYQRLFFVLIMFKLVLMCKMLAVILLFFPHLLHFSLWYVIWFWEMNSF